MKTFLVVFLAVETFLHQTNGRTNYVVSNRSAVGISPSLNCFGVGGLSKCACNCPADPDSDESLEVGGTGSGSLGSGVLLRLRFPAFCMPTPRVVSRAVSSSSSSAQFVTCGLRSRYSIVAR